MFHSKLATVGTVEFSVNKYPVTAKLSDAVKLLTETISEEEVVGIVNAETTGFVTSGNIITTCALLLVEIFPAASFVHA